MQPANIGPVGDNERTQSPFDLFLIFAGANIVATTLQVGATLAPAFSFRAALALIGAGSIAGSGLVAALAPLGPRLGVPSVIAAQAAGTAAYFAASPVGGTLPGLAVSIAVYAGASRIARHTPARGN